MRPALVDDPLIHWVAQAVIGDVAPAAPQHKGLGARGFGHLEDGGPVRQTGSALAASGRGIRVTLRSLGEWEDTAKMSRGIRIYIGALMRPAGLPWTVQGATLTNTPTTKTFTGFALALGFVAPAFARARRRSRRG